MLRASRPHSWPPWRRGYANLGLLTEYHWDTAPTVFATRGLLYAQRLVARLPGDPAALRVRAYVGALIGLHSLALSDLDAARNLAAADPKAPPAPHWAEVIDAYVHFDLRRLDALRGALRHSTGWRAPVPRSGPPAGPGRHDPRRAGGPGG